MIKDKADFWAKTILIGAAAIVAAIIAYYQYLTHYADIFINSGRLMVVLVIIGLLLITVLVLSRNIRVNGALVVIAVLPPIFIISFILEIIDYKPYFLDENRYELATAQGINFDRRSRMEVIDDLTIKGIQAVSYIEPSDLLGEGGEDSGIPPLQPLGSCPRTVLIMCNENGTFPLYHLDEHGFNNPLGLYETGNIDIAVVGDSFAFGMCVSQWKDSVGILREKGVKAINFGYPAGPLQAYATLREYVEPLRPKVVLWMYFEKNDLWELEEQEASGLFSNYMDNPNFTQDLMNRQAEIKAHYLHIWQKVANEKRKNIIAGETKKSRSLIDILNSTVQLSKLRYLSRVVGLDTQRLSKGRFNEILIDVNKRVNAWGGDLYFVYLPQWFRYATGKQQDGSYWNHDQVVEVAHSAGIPVIDFYQAIENHPDWMSLFPLRTSGHYSESGYRLLANVIADRLRQDHNLH